MLRYRLDDLGWYQFECLCQSFLKADYGLGLESWGGRGDWGRDAFCNKPLEFPQKGTFQNGPFIFQVKFIEEANAVGSKPRTRLISAVKLEIKKIVQNNYLSKSGVYALLTNVSLKPNLRNEIQDLIQATFPNTAIFTIGGLDICDILDNLPNIRTSFPQILGLRDLNTLLESVVAKPTIERSKAMIEEAKELANVFYPTEAYNQTLHKLNDHYFAVIEGPPEVGKTAIARIIGLSMLSNGWEVNECLFPDEFFQLYSHEKAQIFIADDAFGSTEYDPTRSNQWALNLDRIIRKLDKKHWLIWTARKHILEIALKRMRLQGKSEKFPEPGSILVNATILKTNEKAMILYRHAKAAGFEDESKELLKENANFIVNNPHFTPERIRRLVKGSFDSIVEEYKLKKLTKGGLAEIIKNEIREPTKSMEQAFECLQKDHKRVLISRLDIPKKRYGIDEIEFVGAFERHKPQDLASNYQQLVSDLQQSFLHHCGQGCSYCFINNEGWIHPSNRDLVINYLSSNTSERHKFLNRCSIEGLSLALSIGGGSEGKLAYPFLLYDEDKEIIENRISILVSEATSDQILNIMTIIYEARNNNIVMHSKSQSMLIDSLFQSSLYCILKRLKKESELLSIDILDLYYKMTEFCESYLPSPPLDYIWESKLSEFQETINDAIAHSMIEISSQLYPFLSLVSLLKSEEPRFLKYHDFPICISDLVNKFFKVCEIETDSEIFFDDSPDQLYELYSEESHRYDSLYEIADQLSKFQIEFDKSVDVEGILSAISFKVEYYQSQAEENSIDEPDFERESYTKSGEEYISISTIFNDL